MTSSVLDDHNLYESSGTSLISPSNIGEIARRESISPSTTPTKNISTMHKPTLRPYLHQQQEEKEPESEESLERPQDEDRMVKAEEERQLQEAEAIKERQRLKEEEEKKRMEAELERQRQAVAKANQRTEEDIIKKQEADLERQRQEAAAKAILEQHRRPKLNMSGNVEKDISQESEVNTSTPTSSATISTPSIPIAHSDTPSSSAPATFSPSPSSTPVKVPLYIVEFARDLHVEQKMTLEQVNENLMNEGHSQKIVDAIIEILKNDTETD